MALDALLRHCRLADGRLVESGLPTGGSRTAAVSVRRSSTFRKAASCAAPASSTCSPAAQLTGSRQFRPLLQGADRDVRLPRALPALFINPMGKLEAMTYGLKRGVLLLPLMASVLLSACVSQSRYDELQAQYQQAQQQNAALSAQVAADKAQICRLQGAIKYTVNSDLLFPSGGWQMSDRGKQIIAGFAAKLAPTQQNKILVSGYTDNAPIGPALQREGITSNLILSQKRAENVMEFLLSQGVKPDLIAAQGFGDGNPVGSNATPQGRAQNRRVELSLAGSSC
jgi:chemotaxis protein MotB